MKHSIDQQGAITIDGWVVPPPRGVSAEARAFLTTPVWGGDPVEPVPMWALRDVMDEQTRLRCEAARQVFPVEVSEIDIAGVRCHKVSPPDMPAENANRLLINLHGGGFVLGSGSLIEAIPIAHATRVPVLVIDYRLAPEHRFPCAVDDVVAVYRALLERYAPARLGLYGASAGGYLAGQVVVRLEREGLPLPACCGIFTAGGDLSDIGETSHLFTFQGFGGAPVPPLGDPLNFFDAYVGDADAEDAAVSPMQGELAFFPPTLLVSGTRDFLLSATASFHRALCRHGVDARLFVFEAMPHAHWYVFELPEAREAIDLMAKFFLQQLE